MRLLHRLPAGVKLAGLLVFALLTVLVAHVVVTAGLLVAVLAASLWAGPGCAETWRVLRGFAIIALLVFGVQAWQHDLERAVVVAGGLLAVVLAANLVTATTPMDAIVDVVVWLVRPFRRWGADPERVALAFSLVIRAVPATMELAAQTRDAALARGLHRQPRAYLTPLVLRTVAGARATGEALHARGLTD
ncbi:energy-coupling factor transporter transmembrane component T family protein [Bogoriella caseilytica]|uniref:Biotin transport system permease protein n=1 Tax=Bogoriella caseilytica TaxID=56055 RepID=A0A3N2BA45_9MICO|nr:energy-coupling factor transporter transmembrane component T [Bogoriella caseilytica]ROR72150.1 biotin transport system permease protein [Bogoriella caseilytica]